ncbi:MAG: DUF4262 domain-containing protein [Actinomycetes bacterium]
MTNLNLVESCREELRARGFVVVAVEGERSECDWAYTVGLHRSAGHPELVLVGLDAAMAGGVLDAVGQRVLDGENLLGAPSLRAGPLEFVVHEVDPLWRQCGDWFALGRAVLGADWPRTLQLVWPDRAGRFPQIPGDPRWSLRQPLLAER